MVRSSHSTKHKRQGSEDAHVAFVLIVMCHNCFLGSR